MTTADAKAQYKQRAIIDQKKIALPAEETGAGRR